MTIEYMPKEIREAYKLVTPYYKNSKSVEDFYKHAPKEIIETHEKIKKWSWDKDQSL